MDGGAAEPRRNMDPILHIDEPAEHVIDREIARITGWYCCEGPQDRLALRFADRRVDWRAVERPDVARAHPRGVSAGFCILVDLSEYVASRGRGAPALALYCGDSLLVSHELHIRPEVWERVAQLPSLRRRKRQWLMERICCPNCRGALRLQDDPVGDGTHETLICESCGLEMPQRGDSGLNLLPRDLADEADIIDTQNVSAHPYDDVAREVIQQAEQRGEMVLDCGSGLRTEIAPSVVACEIADYPSTDLRAVNQNLPIEDDSFGAVLSLNVLEHVDDPFRCARELIRVLKPGGRLYCVAPFLQPLHGYPRHYFNMTKSGLDRLFRGAGTVESHTVPLSGHPIWSLHWFLTSYLESLPENQRDRFRGLTVREILDRSEEEWLADELVQKLSEEGRWTLASTTALVLRKS